MRISTFNVENLFSRASVMNLDSWEKGRPILNDIAQLTDLLAEEIYTDEIKKRIEKILTKYKLNDKNKKDQPFIIRENHGKLYKIEKATKRICVTAAGRKNWFGWIELKRDDFSGITIENTAHVIGLVNADIQLVIEVENRIVLDRFNVGYVSKFKKTFPHSMLVDGNDERGIDIGLLSNYPVRSISSHIDDIKDDKKIFSRDCPEYEIELPNGKTLIMIGNHLKSKGFGDQGESDRKRRIQAERVVEIYNEARKRSENIIIAGDFNDFPTSEAVSPILKETDLRDVMTHQQYVSPPNPKGTYGTCQSDEQKIDYILLSPALWEKVSDVGIETKGLYAPRTFEHLATVTSKATAASDHAALWVDLSI